MKKILSCLIITITIALDVFIILFGLKPHFNNSSISTSEMDEIKEEITTTSIDTKIYNKLNIKSLYVESKNENDLEKIKWYYKNSNNTYYLFLPKLFDRSNIKINFDCGSNTYLSVYENGNLVKKVLNMESISLPNDNYEFKLETNVKNPTSYKVKIMQSNISSIFINVDGGDKNFSKIKNDKKHKTKFGGDSAIADINGNVTYVKLNKIQGRGNITWPREKKPFKIKFEEKVAVLGMEKAKSWNLIANYMDGTLSRNYIWYKLARKIGLTYGVDVEPIDLYINNEYQGSYVITSKVQVNKRRVNIKEDEYLFEIDTHQEPGKIRLNHGYSVSIHNPDMSTLNANQKRKIKNNAKTYLNKIESLIYNPKTKHEEIIKYIDLESFAKCYWIQEISLNFDAARNSFYVFEKDGKLYCGPIWDMDATLNRSWRYAKTTGYYVIENSMLKSRTGENWFAELMKRDDFSTLVDMEYFKNADTFNNLDKFLDDYSEKIKESVAMNYTRYSYQNMINSQVRHAWISGNKDYESSRKMLRNSIVTRTNWYKNEYANLKYDSLTYHAYDENDNEIKSNIISENDENILPINTKKIIIYGSLNNKESKIKEINIIGNEKIDGYIEIKKNARSSVKKYNKYIYNLNFKLSEEG